MTIIPATSDWLSNIETSQNLSEIRSLEPWTSSGGTLYMKGLVLHRRYLPSIPHDTNTPLHCFSRVTVVV